MCKFSPPATLLALKLCFGLLEIKKETKSFLCGSIWIAQVRYDLSRLVSLTASSISLDVANPRFLHHFSKLSPSPRKNECARRHYLVSPFPGVGICSHPVQLISYPDTGFAYFPRGGSTGSHFIGLWRPLSSDGVAECPLRPLLMDSREIHRAVRSSLASEAIDLRPSIDLSYWAHPIAHGNLYVFLQRDGFGATNPPP